ncbi:MAG TPA: DUF1015 domain-containing protein [Gemmatales bacterium]|nr:DUF1015 domain-containing protein [Gemmatales bacterium]
MADVQPFAAWRYDLGHVGCLSDVVAPPYDVIDADLQQRLYARSPCNVVRLELTRPEPGDEGDDARYHRADRWLRDWKHNGILRQDPSPALYVCHQTFTVDGVTHTRRGVLARVRLEPFGQGRIFPHEQTLAGPKADRLKLYHATLTQLSPVFGLYPDDGNAVQERLDAAVRRQPPLVADDHLGVRSSLWPLADPTIIRDVVAAFHAKPIYIADGHHRYETACRLRDDLAARGELAGDQDPAHFVLMALVSMSDPGLQVFPTHRLVAGLPDLTAPQLADLLADHFELTTLGTGPDAAAECWEHVETAPDQSVLGFGTQADGQWQTARLRRPDALDALAPDHSPAWRGLGVARLHVLVLDHLLGPRLGAQLQCQYVHRLVEVTTALAAKRVPLGVLVPPASVAQVATIAGQHEKMPPKSTYFYPKLLTGLVLYGLR